MALKHIAVILTLGCAGAASVSSWVRPDGHVERRQISPREELFPCDTDPENDNCDCERDSDCSQRPRGECHPGWDVALNSSEQDPGLVQTCRYHDCEADRDCPNGLCVPAGHLRAVNTCIRVSCRSNAECRGGTCLIYPTSEGSSEAHCVANDSVCSASGSCGGEHEDADGNFVEQRCQFENRVAVCVETASL